MSIARILFRSNPKPWITVALAVFFGASLLGVREWIGFLAHGGAQVASALGESGLLRHVNGPSEGAWDASLQCGDLYMSWSEAIGESSGSVHVEGRISYSPGDYGRIYYLTTNMYTLRCSVNEMDRFADVEAFLVRIQDGATGQASEARHILVSAASSDYSDVRYYAAHHGGLGLLLLPLSAVRYALVLVWASCWTLFPQSWIPSVVNASLAVCWVGFIAAVITASRCTFGSLRKSE